MCSLCDVCACVCVYVCGKSLSSCVHVLSRVFVHPPPLADMHKHIHTYSHAQTYTHKLTCTNKNTHTHMHKHIHRYSQAHKHHASTDMHEHAGMNGETGCIKGSHNTTAPKSCQVRTHPPPHTPLQSLARSVDTHTHAHAHHSKVLQGQ